MDGIIKIDKVTMQIKFLELLSILSLSMENKVKENLSLNAY